MRSSLVKVHDIRFEKAIKLLLLEDQEVIQAFASHTSQKAFTDGICAAFGSVFALLDGRLTGRSVFALFNVESARSLSRRLAGVRRWR